MSLKSVLIVDFFFLPFTHAEHINLKADTVDIKTKQQVCGDIKYYEDIHCSQVEYCSFLNENHIASKIQDIQTMRFSYQNQKRDGEKESAFARPRCDNQWQ